MIVEGRCQLFFSLVLSCYIVQSVVTLFDDNRSTPGRNLLTLSIYNYLLIRSKKYDCPYPPVYQVLSLNLVQIT